MNQANLERLQMLLKGHEEMIEEKRLRPEGVLRQNDPFREQFKRVARTVDPARAGGDQGRDGGQGRVRLDLPPFDRGRPEGEAGPLGGLRPLAPLLRRRSTKVVKVLHEGIGFGLLIEKMPLSQLSSELVEEEAMKFLKRLFGQEQLRRPNGPPGPRDRRARLRRHAPARGVATSAH